MPPPKTLCLGNERRPRWHHHIDVSRSTPCPPVPNTISERRRGRRLSLPSNNPCPLRGLRDRHTSRLNSLRRSGCWDSERAPSYNSAQQDRTKRDTFAQNPRLPDTFPGHRRVLRLSLPPLTLSPTLHLIHSCLTTIPTSSQT